MGDLSCCNYIVDTCLLSYYRGHSSIDSATTCLSFTLLSCESIVCQCFIIGCLTEKHVQQFWLIDTVVEGTTNDFAFGETYGEGTSSVCWGVLSALLTCMPAVAFIAKLKAEIA